MEFSENCNGRKRAAEEQEFVQDEDLKRPCRSAGREYEYGLYEALVSSDDNKMGMENSIESLVETDDVFIYNGADNSAFEHLILNGDLGRAAIRFPRDEHANCGLGYGKNLSNDLLKDSDDVGKFSEVGISSYESENPLEGLDLFFDDVGLDFGVPEDHETCRDSPIVGDKHESDLICNEDAWAAAASGVNKTEQAFVEENEVHDWLFSSDQADPSLGYGISDLLEPSITPLLKGMAGS